MTPTRRPVLYVVACGGRAAGDLPTFIPEVQRDGWDVCVIATPTALRFLDIDTLAALTGHVVRHEYKQPNDPDVLPPADAFAVAPATFNTINKMAAGISDTLALGILNEALGLELPIVAVPTANTGLARHPAFVNSIRQLQQWGIRLLFDPEKYPLPTPNMGPPAAALFPWGALLSTLRDLQLEVLKGASGMPA